MIKKLISSITKHAHVQLTPSGNKAIENAINLLKSDKNLLIQDQGGWYHYYKYPERIGLKVKRLRTDYGIVDLEDLKKNVNDAFAIIYENPAGYFAEQPIKEIYDICKGRCKVILDVTGCIGDSDLCNGEFADIIVCSFGYWKPINLGYGGFISAKSIKLGNDEFDEKFLEPLSIKFKNLGKRYQFLTGKSKKIKSDLENFDIIHKEKKGINVVIKYKDKQESIISYCKKNNLQFIICPKYFRVNEKAISIEVKRL